jgi:hypothetical protein
MHLNPNATAAQISALHRLADHYMISDEWERASACRQLAQDLAAELAAETQARADALREIANLKI